MQESVFQDTVDNGHSLITKILIEIPAAHKSWILAESMSFGEIDKYQYLKEQLNFPAAPSVKPISADLTLDTCLNEINNGLQLHRALLKVISKKMHSMSTTVDDLQHDIRDLLLLVHKLQTLVAASSTPSTLEVWESQLQADLIPRLNSEYKLQLAAHLTLLQLQQFSKDVRRSLQSMLDHPALDTMP